MFCGMGWISGADQNRRGEGVWCERRERRLHDRRGGYGAKVLSRFLPGVGALLRVHHFVTAAAGLGLQYFLGYAGALLRLVMTAGEQYGAWHTP